MLHAVINLFLIFLLIALPQAAAATSSAPPFSIAFFYASNPPLNDLKAFDIVVVDPDASGVSPLSYNSPASQLFAYLSVGEADPNRAWFPQLDPVWLVADNHAWKSKVVDLGNPRWRTFFLDKVVEPLWKAGYRGFFLDTLDSYRLVKEKGRHPELEAGLVETIREIKKRHPEARLILNRGFEQLEQLKDITYAVAAESLFQGFNPVGGNYAEVAEQDRQWLLSRFKEVQKAGLPVISIDYVPPGNRELARRTATKIREAGYIPWVTDKDLESLGVGALEVMPRTILGLYDGNEGADPIYANLQRLAAMPLNYLGYKLELRDLRQPLPKETLNGRYAGILVWPNSDTSGVKHSLLPWVKRQTDSGIKVVFLERFGAPPEQAAATLGLIYRNPARHPAKLDVLSSAPLLGFELPVLPHLENFVPILAGEDGEALLTVGSGKTPLADPVALTPWGGYALAPFVVDGVLGDNYRWVVDPFDFFVRALRLPLQPAPDTTTENGVRLLFSHIDADGFESRVERPGGQIGGAELRERILEKYRIPVTFSIITSILGDHAANPERYSLLQQEARKIFSLPFVEAASHTYSHPFYWQETEVASRNYATKNLPIPGYQFNLEKEIVGSARFINQNLLPPGKRVELLQWSGDCTPGADALSIADNLGLNNINGGATIVTKSSNSLTLVAPLGVEKGGYFQVFAPNQNENIYTNDWSGPFYGYRRVVETFQLTDSPRRLKPINIYYHVYSVTKEASRRALEDVYGWALGQKAHAIHTSEYVSKVLDFNRTVVARVNDGWLIRNGGQLRQLRLPKSAGYPDLAASTGVAGFSDHNDQRYIHLAPGVESLLKLSAAPPPGPWVASAAARITRFDRSPGALRLAIAAKYDAIIRFGNAAGCRLKINGEPGSMQREGSDRLFQVTAGNHELELVCE